MIPEGKKMGKIGLALLVFAFLTSVMTFLYPSRSWSEGQAVKPGDEANVQFTCRLKSGGVVASSLASVAADPKSSKSPIFVPRKTDTPVPIVASGSPPPSEPNPERGLEGEIARQLSGQIVGMRVGETRTRDISAAPLSEEKESNYIVRMTRVRKSMKEMRFARQDYEHRAKKAAEVGQTFFLDPGVQGTVSSVTESEVVVRFTAHAGDKVATPLGQGTIRELPDRYETLIDAHVGDLVRGGKLTGRITAVDDQFITVDYGNPFGGETLSCDILVESVKQKSVPESKASAVP